MAIEFARVEILHAGSKSAPAKSAYIGRSKARDWQSGESYNFERQGGLIDSGFVLPADAPEWAADMDRLWNEAQEAEYTTDRKTGERRLKSYGRQKDGSAGRPQVARDISLALPRELSDEQNRQLLTEFIDQKFGKSNVAVQWAIHRDDANHNPHAHLLVSTRRLTARGFGTKARELNPDFLAGGVIRPDHFARQWAEFQNEFFISRGMELRVDPTRIVASRHNGPARYIEDSRRQIENGQLTAEALEKARDPEKLLEHLTSRRATFSERDVDWHLKKVGLDEQEREAIKAQIMERPELIRLRDDADAQLFTTTTVWEQEKRVADAATSLVQDQRLAASDRARRQAAHSRTMDDEQLSAFAYATSAGRLAVVKGRAGTGKSYTMGAIREAYEADGFRVVGLAPTNTVAADMRADGFKEGRTIASEILRQQHEREVWDSRTVIMLDEFGMVSTRDMEMILARAEATGSKVIAFGDDRQLASVERGGMFGYVADLANARELTTVRRQSVDWQRTASEAASRGEIGTALQAYQDRGYIRWADDMEKARADLVRDWREAAQDDAESAPFVYAATNDAVNRFNDEIRNVRKELGQLDRDEHHFVVEKAGRTRQVDVSAGDRVLFNKSVKDRQTGLDLRNGEFGVVERIEGERMTVRTDGGRVVSFDAREHNGWDLGYAGTVYKGQGKTQGRVWAFHDSAAAWRAETSYVGLTRHKAELRIYANRQTAPRGVEDLGRSMQRQSDNRPALAMQRVSERAQERSPFQQAFVKWKSEREKPRPNYFENKARIERETREHPERVQQRQKSRDRGWER